MQIINISNYLQRANTNLGRKVITDSMSHPAQIITADFQQVQKSQQLKNYELDFDNYSLLEKETKKQKHRRPHMVDDHISVLLNEAVDGLNPVDGGVYIDCTFGAGGHTKTILERANCTVIAIDRDPQTKVYADYYKKFYGDRLVYINGRFSDLKSHVQALGLTRIDGVLMDIGVSSMQLDTPRRGFSFMNDGPLDMRMGEESKDAFQLINFATEEELAGIIYKYGDERRSRAIAKAIVNHRLSNGEISRTLQLADIIKKSVGGYNDSIHPATRTFQAIRIWVNDELAELEQALESAEEVLSKNGVLAVITFHSGEDAIVKNFINEKSGKRETFSRYSPMSLLENQGVSTLEPISRKAIAPSDEEVKSNIRARSAKLRLARKIK